MGELTKLGFKKKRDQWKGTAAATLAGSLTSIVPGVPLGAGLIAGAAPEGHKVELASKATAGGVLASVPVGLYGLRQLAKDVSKTNKPDYKQLGLRARELGKEFKAGEGFHRIKAFNRMDTLKHIMQRSKGATKRMYAANILLGGLGTGYAYHKASKPYYKKASLVKLGFHPESFTSPSYEKDQEFINAYSRPGVGGRLRRTLNNPVTWALGGVSLFLSHKKRSDNPESIWPYLTGGMLAAISIKRWSNATKREKAQFVKQYNATMGTTFTVDHAKMQSLWNMTHAHANRIDRMKGL